MWNRPAASWPFCCRQLKTVWPCSYCHGSASTAVISCNVMTMQMGCWLTPTAVLHLHTCVRQQVWKIRMRVKLLVVSSCQDTIANLTHLINQTCIPSCCRSTVTFTWQMCWDCHDITQSCLHFTKATKHHQEACCRGAQICSTWHVRYEIVCSSNSLSNISIKATRKC